jgi:asparagine synthase (glutamine-hydrolysing)
MSVQFGRWNFDGQAPAPEYIEKVGSALAPYGPDANERYSKDGVSILYRAFHTTNESRREVQPHVSPSGVTITWDGVLDNRKELISDLRNFLTLDSTDLSIVAAAYEKWGDECLGKLIGDWALSVWNPRDRTLLLAKDPIGTHQLYYSIEKDHVVWCTVLDPLVRFAGKTFTICDEYIAGWFLVPAFPAAHLTPYVGIHNVPPSSFAVLRLGRHGIQHKVSKYWDFDPGKRVHHRTDAEYEEHFRVVFAQAVQRKLRSDRPVLAELSGGMDSSSIVCVADTIIDRGQAECPRLDTISWFDDSYDHLEPDTNEFHWFAKVEEKRGRTGYHINHRELNSIQASAPPISFASQFANDRFAATPIPNNSSSSGEFYKRCRANLESEGYRVILSGIAGDEPTGGGVPTPIPELQNFLARARFLVLLRRLNAWAQRMRKPRLSLLWEAVRGFFSAPIEDECAEILKTPWFRPAFARRYRPAFCGYPSRIRFFGPLPSFQDHIEKLEFTRRFLAGSLPPSTEFPAQVRYPFCDRDFREFMYAIPREQIVGIGKRRHLMKRALVGIVPDEVLNRRKKSFVEPEPVTRESKKGFSDEWPSPAEIAQCMFVSSTGMIDPDQFLRALEDARRNEVVPVHSLKRTLTLEYWLRHLAAQGVVANLSSKGAGSAHRGFKPARANRRSEDSLLVPVRPEERQIGR